MSDTPEQFAMKLEVVVIPVADVDRAVDFYRSLGWRLDNDLDLGPEFRVVQFTPPGSECSIHFGHGVTSLAPGSVQGTYLVVSDINRARKDLISRGIEVSEVYHNRYDTGVPERVDGYPADGGNYAALAWFSDPDGNGWLLQEVEKRLPGR
jgi:catechol 2,3-dioxygenase-like lactoylglutathione lyase family enzyme